MIHEGTRRAFTLLEVLVVIAIILIIGFFLLPRSNTGRSYLNARCLNNERQVGMGVLMYAAENGRRIPDLDAVAGNDGPLALSLITNYAHDSKVFMCSYLVGKREQNRTQSTNELLPQIDAGFLRSNGNDYAYYDGLKYPSPTNAFLADRLAWTNRKSIRASKMNHPQGSINAIFGDGHGQSLGPDKVVGANYTPPWSAVQDPLLRP